MATTESGRSGLVPEQYLQLQAAKTPFGVGAPAQPAARDDPFAGGDPFAGEELPRPQQGMESVRLRTLPESWAERRVLAKP